MTGADVARVMNRMLRTTLVLAAALCASCILVSSCVIVKVDGERIAEEVFGDLLDGGGQTPNGFRHGEVDFSLRGSPFGKTAQLEMDFDCAEEDVDAYFEAVCEEVERNLVDEREGVIETVTSDGLRRRTIEYDTDEGRGAVKVAVLDVEDAAVHDYRLSIELRE